MFTKNLEQALNSSSPHTAQKKQPKPNKLLINQSKQHTMSVPAPNQPPSPRSSSSTTQQPPVFTPLHGHGHGSLHSESVAGSPLGASLDGGAKRGSVSIGGSGGGRRASGVIPSPSGRRGSGSVLTPGGQVVAYHTRTNVSSVRTLRSI